MTSPSAATVVLVSAQQSSYSETLSEQSSPSWLADKQVRLLSFLQSQVQPAQEQEQEQELQVPQGPHDSQEHGRGGAGVEAGEVLTVWDSST